MLGEKLLCDRYVLEEKLGSGSLGDIYRATDTRTNRAVAVRMVTKIRDPLVLATYYRQWAIQAGLRDENVGEILDIGESTENEERYPVIVTPLFESAPLFDLFLQPLSNSATKDWLKGIHRAALGLQKAHERGLLHGRLHSGNILLSRDGRVRVVDFGAGGSTPRKEGVQADIAGLGAVAFEALTGAEAPTTRMAGESALQSAKCAATELTQVIARAIWPDFEPAFHDAAEFAAALQTAIAKLESGSDEPGSTMTAKIERQTFPETARAEARDSAKAVEEVASGLKGLGERMALDESSDAAVESLADIEQRAAAEADLGEAVHLLQRAAASYPDSVRLQRLIALYREKLEVVSQVLARTEELEGDGKFAEAAEQRELLKSIHPAAREDVPAIGSRPGPLPKAETKQDIEETIDLPDLSSQTAFYQQQETEEQEESDWLMGEQTSRWNDDSAVEEEQPSLVEAKPVEPETEITGQWKSYKDDPAVWLGESAQPAVEEAPADEATPAVAAETTDFAVTTDFDEPWDLTPETETTAIPVVEASPQPETKPIEIAATTTEKPAAAPQAKQAKETKPPVKAAAVRPKWILIAAAGLFAIVTLGLILMFSGSGSPTVILRQAEIRAYPPEAEILIDGQRCGVGECAIELESGSHRATAQLAGFVSEFEMFEIEAPESGIPSKNAPPQRVELYLTALFPSVDIETDLADGNVYLDGVKVGELEDGAFSLRELPDGEHELRVQSGTIRTTLMVQSQAGSAPRIVNIASTEAKVLAASTLAGAATFWTATPDTQILVDGEEKGAAGPQGIQIGDLLEGPHNVGAAGSGATASFRSDNQPRLALALNTDRNVGGLRIVAGQDGATVYLNGREYRRKTARGALLVFLYPGSYRVRVEKPGFVPSPEYTVEVVKGTREVVQAELKPQARLATLVLRDATPGAEIRIDSELVGEVPANGSFTYEAVPAGERVIQIGRAGYQTRTSTRRFESGQQVSLDGALERSDGELTVAVTPANAGALIVVRNAQGDIVPLQNGRATVPEGGYRVETSANGFRSQTTEVRVRAGENFVAEVRLEPTVAVTTGPKDLAAAFAQDPAWTREGEALVRRGGEAVLVPVQGQGKYRFSVNIMKGRRLQWMVNYTDENNYSWFQLGRDNFIRAIVTGGQRSKPVQVSHGLNDFRAVVIEIDVSDNEIVHRLWVNDDWVELDRWTFTGADFAKGQFGFRLPGRDELAVYSLAFTPAR